MKSLVTACLPLPNAATATPGFTSFRALRLGSAECTPVDRESDDCRTLRIRAQPAVDALNVLSVALGADDDLPTFGGLLDIVIRGIFPKDHNHWARILPAARAH